MMSTRAPHQSRERSWASVQVCPWSRLRTDQTSLKMPGVRFVGLVVPAPIPLPGVHEHQHQDTPRASFAGPAIPGALRDRVPGTRGPCCSRCVRRRGRKWASLPSTRQETAVVQQHEGPVTVGDQLSGLGVSPFGSRRRSRGPCGEARRPETQPDQDGESHRHGAPSSRTGSGSDSEKIWLGDRDSNPDNVVQSHACCRYTIPQPECRTERIIANRARSCRTFGNVGEERGRGVSPPVAAVRRPAPTG